MSNEGLSFVIPAYQEENHIGKAILQIVAEAKWYDLPYEIIIVDDGSTDDTINCVLREKKSLSWVDIRFEKFEKNKGKGKAVREGCKLAKYETIIILDADLSVSPDHFKKTYKHLKEDYNFRTAIIGQRVQTISQPKSRILLGSIFRLLVRIISRVPVKDTQCPYKVLHKIDKEFFETLTVDGFAYDVELIKKIQDCAIVEKQLVLYENREDSRVKLKHMVDMFKDIIKL